MTGIYIHIPFCRSKCDYCAFYSVAIQDAVAARYLDALFLEMDLRTAGATRVATDTIYIGGGTPSVLPRGFLSRILDKVYARFDVSPSAEITVEANPESCGKDFANELMMAGVNRVSLGLQSHENAVLKQIGRPHMVEDFQQAVSILTAAGIRNLNADIMTGLPNQSLQSVLDSVAFATDASDAVRHISLYALSVEEDTPLYQSGFFPDEDLQADMYTTTVAELGNRGFARYEVSNFAKAGFESRHNLKYWTGEQYFGFGAGAHSLILKPQSPTPLQSSAHCGLAVRTENYADLAHYLMGEFQKSEEVISPAVRAEELLMLSLRTREGLNISEYATQTGRNLLEEKFAAINELLLNGLIEQKNMCLTVTDSGFYVLNSILLKLL